MTEVIDFINGLLWGSVLIYLLIGTGLYFTVKLGFIQFRHFTHMFSVLAGSRKSSNEGVSSFQALCTSLAARVGTGNLAGVAVAITAGGPGAVFWMWLIAVIGMATSFAESSLAQLFKTKDADGNFRGGPAYYMEKGLGRRWMGVVFSICLIVAFGLVFNAVQSDAIANSMHNAFGFDKTIVGIVIVAFTSVIIFGGLRVIGAFAEIVVPFMALAYILIAFVVVAMNISELPAVFELIIKSAFGLDEAAGGALGVAMMQGIKRGLFSNEAGMGSAPNAAASAAPFPNHPASQGYVQMLGVFIDTIVICTATASIILLSDLGDTGGVGGIELTQHALSSHVGDWGNTFVAIAIMFFAFTSIIANYSYAETSILFLNRDSKVIVWIFRVVVLAMVMFGAVAKSNLIWNMADASMGLMALVNIIAILMLSKFVIVIAKDYNKQLDAGKTPTFDSSEYPEIDKIIN
ncbi:MAG: alanine/glycine:cation symporter family protein, partial [Moritella sp.]|uniref:alanine/glycine:cation symporter family protein n=1 Tax=Moritella sp. TaxID=78556 RepID=UPI0029B33BD2